MIIFPHNITNRKVIISFFLSVVHILWISIIIWRVSSQNGLNPFWSIWDIWDLSCWNLKKIIRKFVILLIITSKIFLYEKVIICIIRWCPYFKNFKKWHSTRFAIKLFICVPQVCIVVCLAEGHKRMCPAGKLTMWTHCLFPAKGHEWSKFHNLKIPLAFVNKIAGYDICRQNLSWYEISTNKTYKW